MSRPTTDLPDLDPVAALLLGHDVDDLPMELTPELLIQAAAWEGLDLPGLGDWWTYRDVTLFPTQRVSAGRDEDGRTIYENERIPPRPEAILAVRAGLASLDVLADEPRSHWQTIVDRYLSELNSKAAKKIGTASVAPPDVASLLHVPGELTAREGAPRPIVDGLILSNQTILFTAPPKLGKSYIRSALTRSLIDGTPFYGRHVEKTHGRVVVVDLEMHAGEADAYLAEHDLAGRDEVRLAALQGRQRDFDVLNEAVLDRWIETLNAVEAQVLIVDTTTAAFSASGVNAIQGMDVKRWLQKVEELRHRSTVEEIILIGHSLKDGRTPGGAVELQGGVDGVWVMTQQAGGKRRLKATIRTGVGATLVLPAPPKDSVYTGDDLSANASRVLEDLKAVGEDSMTQVRNRVGMNSKVMGSAVEELTKVGRVNLLDTPKGKRLVLR